MGGKWGGWEGGREGEWEGGGRRVRRRRRGRQTQRMTVDCCVVGEDVRDRTSSSRRRDALGGGWFHLL